MAAQSILAGQQDEGTDASPLNSIGSLEKSQALGRFARCLPRTGRALRTLFDGVGGSTELNREEVPLKHLSTNFLIPMLYLIRDSFADINSVEGGVHA
ncbi:MAG TPA: hypothetical protein VFY36_03840 [Solirubrobacteraceae bacterium]|nr:hypothetical protein [Solirubrobacteraceae bacterium]